MNNYSIIRRVVHDVKDSEGSRFALTRQFIQHGETSVMKHCIAVAIVSCMIARVLRLRVDGNALIRGALLHDYFLYDWHVKDKNHTLHGFKHPYKALHNAMQDFDLNDKEQDIILRHMFPLTPIPPMSKEGWIVCMADKYCSTKETMYTIKRYARNVAGLVHRKKLVANNY